MAGAGGVAATAPATQARLLAVHPTLARILASWKLSGWQELIGRAPGPDDLLIPSRRGKHRSVNHGRKRFHQDLARLKLRKRRLHDLRRTLISLALADGGRKDVLRWMTHGTSTDIMDSYTTLPWSALCGEMAKLRIELREGQVIALPRAATGSGVDDDRATMGATRSDKGGLLSLSEACRRVGRPSKPEGGRQMVVARS